MNTRLDESLATLRDACGPYLGQSLNVVVSFSGHVTGYIPAYAATVEGDVQPDHNRADMPANDLRMHLLRRAHDLIAVLAGIGWVLRDEPRFEFTSSVDRPVVRVSGVLVEPPKEHGIGLSVKVPVVRVVIKGQPG